MKIYFINRDVDRKRRRRFLASLPNGYSAKRISAINAYSRNMDWRRFASWNRNNFWGRNSFKPGAFACFLSHAKAWKRVLEGDDEWVMICEDDAVFVNDPKPVFERYTTGRFDLLHVNERISTWVQAHGEPVEGVHDLNACVHSIMENRLEFSPRGIRPSPGAEGYILNKRAASILLDRMKQTGIECGVDWFIVAAGIDGRDLKTEDVSRYGTLSFLSRYFIGNDRYINSGIVYPPLVKEMPAQISGQVLDHHHQMEFEVFA